MLLKCVGTSAASKYSTDKECSYDVLGQYAAFEPDDRRKTMLFLNKFNNVAIKHEQPPLLTQS